MVRTRGNTSKKAKGKQIVEHEEEEPQLNRHDIYAQKVRDREEKARKRRDEARGRQTPTRAEVCKKLMDMPFKGTRFPDTVLLEELGLLADVSAIFRELGAEKWFHSSYPSYQLETCQFLSSLTVMTKDEDGVDRESEGQGFILFKIGRTTHRMGFKKLSEVLGFAEREGPGGFFFNVEKEELKKLWRFIGSESFKAGKVKAAWIRNPAIRYAHKVLAHTFFGKKVSTNVFTEELEMLDIGLKNIIGFFDDGAEVKGDTRGASLVHVWVYTMQGFIGWALGKPDKVREISVGGFITPVLIAAGVILREPTAERRYIDAVLLQKGNFLVKEGLRYSYKLNLSKEKDGTIPLPCPHLTTQSQRDHARFVLQDEILQDIRQRPTYAWDDAWQPDPIPSVYGADRYDFQPYEALNQSESSKKAHQHIKILQRWSRWQDKTIRKLVKTVKDVKHQMKELKSKLNGGSSSVPQQDIEEEAGENTLEMRSHSLRETSTEPIHIEEPRASAYERKRRGKRVMRSPTPQSSNPSYSMDSYSSSSIQF